ncbi:hypothetical protein ACFLQ3_01750 [Bacteroidota bacterium]
MRSLYTKYVILLISGLSFWSTITAQENTTKNCADFLTSGFVSDGQEYIAKLDENNKAKFYTTFYGGSQYRLIGCTDVKDYSMRLSVYDIEKNLLFCNKDYDYVPFWNFSFTSTIDCLIEIELEAEIHLNNEVKLLIGFKEK